MSAAAAPSGRLGGHLWTVVPSVRDLLLPPRALPPGDTVRVAIVDEHFGPGSLAATLRVPPRARDVVVLVHGLGGHRRAGYVLRAAAELHARGVATLAVDLRGADGSGTGVYHVALTDDLHAFCRAPDLVPFERVFVLGFSMGGHVALHLATEPRDARLCGIAAIGTPLDLHATQRYIDRPAAAFYRRWVLQGLKRIYAAVAARHAVPTPWPIVRACRTFHEWDACTICPRYGEATPETFYARYSARQALPHLRVDAVLVLANADPLVKPAHVLPHVGTAAPGRLQVRVLPRGGHLYVPVGQALGLGGLGEAAVGRDSIVVQLAAHWRLGADGDRAAHPPDS